jgi:hypothetical protein
MSRGRFIWPGGGLGFEGCGLGVVEVERFESGRPAAIEDSLTVHLRRGRHGTIDGYKLGCPEVACIDHGRRYERDRKRRERAKAAG